MYAGGKAIASVGADERSAGISKGPRAGASRPRLVLDVTNATATAEAARDLLRVNIFLSRPADTSVRLLDSDGRRLLTWDRGLEAGSTVVEMRVPAGVLAAGTYKVLVSAVGPDGSTVTDTVVIDVPSRDEDDSPTAASSGSAPIPPDAPFSNGPTGGKSEPAAGRGDESSSPRRAKVHSALPAAANPRVQPFQPQKVIAGTVPGGQADGAMPMRKSLGLVLLIVVAASVLLTAFLKAGGLLTLVDRRPL